MRVKRGTFQEYEGFTSYMQDADRRPRSSLPTNRPTQPPPRDTSKAAGAATAAQPPPRDTSKTAVAATAALLRLFAAKLPVTSVSPFHQSIMNSTGWLELTYYT